MISFLRNLILIKWGIRLTTLYLLLEWTYSLLSFSINVNPDPLQLKTILLAIGIGVILHLGLFLSTTNLGKKYPWATLISMLFMFGLNSVAVFDKITLASVLGSTLPLLATFHLFKNNQEVTN